MRTYRYHRVDVFTNHAFGGNPLVVFPDADELSDRQMRAIAREMNLSETVFCVEPTDPSADVRLRIFTVEREIPLAGHPTVGTLHVLATTGRLTLERNSTIVSCELGAGVLPVEVICRDGEVHSVVMTQRAPTFGEPFTEPDILAQALGVTPHELLLGDLPARVVDTGIPWFLIPVRDLQSIRALEPHRELCQEIGLVVGTDLFYAFTQDVEDPECTAHTRHVWFGTVTPGEDPVTGSAGGCLASYLVAEKVVLAAPTADLMFEQGEEVGRPGRIEALVDADAGKVKRVRVGGQAVHLGDGELRF